jgi:hypothetical protein
MSQPFFWSPSFSALQQLSSIKALFWARRNAGDSRERLCSVDEFCSHIFVDHRHLGLAEDLDVGSGPQV